MGTRQARLQRQIERAHERYAGTLLAVGMPMRIRYLTAKNRDAPIEQGEARFHWHDSGWRAQVAQFYLDSHQGQPPPSMKTQKKFIRGFTAWLRKEVEARSGYEDYKFHGVTGRRRK